MKYINLSILLLLLTTPVFAFEDYIITNNGKLTEIRVENNEIIDVFPLVTIMNEKNTLIVRPLKEGHSKFSVLKDNKDLITFSVKVEADETTIKPVEGFDILKLDEPPEEYEHLLDFPPLLE